MSEIPEDLKERARWEIRIFERPGIDTSKKLLERVEELEAQIERVTKERAAAEYQLSGYSMSAGEADQRRCESRAMREELGFERDANDVSPAELRKAFKKALLIAKAEVLLATAEAIENPINIRGPFVPSANCFQLRDDAQRLFEEARQL